MTDADAQYAIVFPALSVDPYFERHSLALSRIVRDRLHLWIFLVEQDGGMKTLSPNHGRFEDAARMLLDNA